jgi:Tfp pilus assembly protein PilF
MRSNGPTMRFGRFLLIGLLLMIGCAGPGGLTESVLDTPEHHVYSGFRLINKARLDDAEREFEHALRLKPNYSPAYRGMGLVYGMKGDFEEAFGFMNQAMECAGTKEQAARTHVGFMRLYTMSEGEGWFEAVEKNFALANKMVTDLPEAHYNMGRAYSRAYRLGEAEACFERVIAINRSLTQEAWEQLELIKTIEAAKPTTPEGRRLAFVNPITRADTAALLVHELPMDRIYAVDSVKGQGKTAEKGRPLRDITVPADIVHHPMREVIEEILRLKIGGLSLLADGSFGPDEYIMRAVFAMVMADIVVAIEKDATLTVRYVGMASPFDDVHESAGYFNAVMICKRHAKIMDGENRLFDPMGTVSGAQALLTIRRLKKKYNLSEFN